MVEYNKVNVKLSDSQLNKLKSTVKRMSMEMFNGNNLPCELLLTTRQATKLRNAIENNMSTDIKLYSNILNYSVWRIFRFIIK